MTTPKHTPGPWFVRQDSDATFDVEKSEGGLRSRICRLHCECLCEEHDGSVAGNARLIAAAPEMLEALLAANLSLDDALTPLSPEEIDECPQFAALRDAWRQCRAALAKATGEEMP